MIPRVDTTYLSDDIYPQVSGILTKMSPYASLTAPVLSKKIPKSKKVFDNSKVTDHHAIIPTGESPSQLVGNERHLYHLIALRFIAAFYPDCEFNQTTALGRVADVEFKATGKVITSQGWRAVFDKKTDTTGEGESQDGDTDRILPPLAAGESGPHTPSLQKRTTQPPKLYTEGTLLRAMETAGKTVDDEELRDAMKENGIGRPSTRASIIETLFNRHYIARQRKNIVATQAGIDLIALINEELLKSAKLTGLWENKLRRIERGDYSASDFIGELKELISSIVLNVLSDNSMRKIAIVDAEQQKKNAPKSKSATGTSESNTKAATPRKPAIKTYEQIQCPLCGKGHILKGRTAFGCSEFHNGCSLRLPFSDYPDTLTPARLNTAIKKNFRHES